MNKFKKYLSEHPEAATRFEKSGSITEKGSEKTAGPSKKAGQKQDDRRASKLP